MTSEPRLIVGAMSGTSADGVDVALCNITGRGLDMRQKLIAYRTEPYVRPLREAILATRKSGTVSLGVLASLGREITLAHARAIAKTLKIASIDARSVEAVAVHGQTLFHAPPVTVQWFDPALLAAELNVKVVSDFRRADCAVGGQGAPLVPFADYILLRDPALTRVMLNIGGIANVTIIPAGAGPEAVAAFDTGPGNCLSDHLVATLDPAAGLGAEVAARGFDESGKLAMSGRIDPAVLTATLSHPYFKAPWPKSTDGPAMIDAFASAGALALMPADALATAAGVVAEAVARALRRWTAESPDGVTVIHELIVSGGGTRNARIMAELSARLSDIRIITSDAVGIPSPAKEAIAFALLGAATLDLTPANLPSVTGAARQVVLGAVTPKPWFSDE